METPPHPLIPSAQGLEFLYLTSKHTPELDQLQFISCKVVVRQNKSVYSNPGTDLSFLHVPGEEIVSCGIARHNSTALESSSGVLSFIKEWEKLQSSPLSI